MQQQLNMEPQIGLSGSQLEFPEKINVVLMDICAIGKCGVDNCAVGHCSDGVCTTGNQG